jgi:hypothetical protein
VGKAEGQGCSPKSHFEAQVDEPSCEEKIVGTNEGAVGGEEEGVDEWLAGYGGNIWCPGVLYTCG